MDAHTWVCLHTSIGEKTGKNCGKKLPMNLGEGKMGMHSTLNFSVGLKNFQNKVLRGKNSNKN